MLEILEPYEIIAWSKSIEAKQTPYWEKISAYKQFLWEIYDSAKDYWDLDDPDNADAKEYFALKKIIENAESWKDYSWIMRKIIRDLSIQQLENTKIDDYYHQNDRIFRSMQEKQFPHLSVKSEAELSDFIVNWSVNIFNNRREGVVSWIRDWECDVDFLKKLDFEIYRLWLFCNGQIDWHDLELYCAFHLYLEKLYDRLSQLENDQKRSDLSKELNA